ncbi:hypothetical protein KBC99_00270 [Candidatus Saccharibacteria bacterium]|nr:hypothetical protein [Candidatus Saccharibacteria bacterium]
MQRYRFVQTHFPRLDEDDEMYECESGEAIERIVFDRKFLTGERGAIRAAKRVFRRRINLFSPFSDEFRLFEIVSESEIRPVLLPRNRQHSYPPRRVEWSSNQTTLVLHG